ncbi:hypothetical protein B0T16DRAFT_411915 [Cercophora newfieldiana]|uniref:Uncharacterized protein n=1 Tax=Cercophora newfieldiana TaxID=92897 RepID=A0AA39Y670_9PEZI|nr:hypothetical protein B0T16DRAFT_411915 [Cercophora newfieldiana]
MCFMFWGCFTWAERGPCYCWPSETAAMKKRYAAQMAQYNKQHEAEDKLTWEMETAMQRL